MSCNYAEGLSPYEHKGKLGLPEKWDKPEEVEGKVEELAKWIREASKDGQGGTVFHTGAGISTAAGIPDFRGPRGVWTLEKRGERPSFDLSWDQARPTKTHLAVARMAAEGIAHFVVSQNIDGLHMRSGLPRSRLAELHGNMFVDRCTICRRMAVRPGASETVGQKVSTRPCPFRRPNGRSCRGRLADFVLDWEDELPGADLDLSDSQSVLAGVNVVLGSTLQIVPSGNLPTLNKKYSSSAKLVIINLQPTKHDKKADLVIRDYVDNVMSKLMDKLGLEIPEHDPNSDPVSLVKGNLASDPTFLVEWTQSEEEAKRMKTIADLVDDEFKVRKKREKECKRAMDNGGVANKSGVKQEASHENGTLAENGLCKKPKVEDAKELTVVNQDVKSEST